MENLAPKYDPKSVEERLYAQWEKGGYFKADPDAPGEPYTIVIPPPNVTGVLHVGHALNGTIQDILIRWKRMQGYNTLWLPGTDHAGIATQHVVAKALAAEGIDTRDLEREDFIKRIWDWKEHHGATIIRQLKLIGCSCDWSRERFTMDEGLSRAVRLVFKTLFDEGLIYRGDYLVNWSPKLQTALSDDEVEHKEVEGHLWHFKYPFTDGSGHAIVATTRPETMLGDTAVAVNPHDERYRDLIGKTVTLPLMNREIPIIGDEFVDKEFGTGMVKVTPAHDPNDYELGFRHDLEFINLLNPDGTLNENSGEYVGLDVKAGRKRVVADMEAAGLVEKIDDYTHSVGHCYRSGCVVEPYMSKQWFVKMRPLAEPAIQAVRDGRTRFVPGDWDKTYFYWLENVRDWCISRQLVWGHQIPVFTCDGCGEVICEIDETPEVCVKCGGKMTQDPDVLDTWFSSQLWPFSTMGWPEKTDDLAKYYPTSVLVTGHDIIFFWVARMIMSGLKFLGDVPFRDVFITPLIMAEGGGKMSKSKGNAVDPLDIVEEQGADAVRLTLASHAAQSRTVNLSMKRFEGYRNFTNKLWNAARFVLMNVEDLSAEDLAAGLNGRDLALEDRWILSQLTGVASDSTAHLEAYELDQYMTGLYDFAWKQYCDWYLELVKARLYAGDKEDSSDAARETRKTAQIVLVTVLENLLRLFHPVAPFITEEIWLKLRKEWGPYQIRDLNPVPDLEVITLDSKKLKATQASSRALAATSIMIAPWPEASEIGVADADAERRIGLLQEAIYQVRKIRGEMGVQPGVKIDLEVVSGNSERRAELEASGVYLKSLLNLGGLGFASEPSDMAFTSTATFEDLTFRVPLPEELRERELARLKKEIGKLEGHIAGIKKKLGNEKFTSNAKPEVVERERERLVTQETELATLASKLDALG